MEQRVEAQAYYEIRIAGRLGPEWVDWFEGLSVTPGPDGSTVLAGVVIDQAALHGHLARVRDLGVPLLAVTRCIPTAGGP